MAMFSLVIMEQKQLNLFLEVVNKSVPRDTVVVEGAGVVGADTLVVEGLMKGGGHYYDIVADGCFASRAVGGSISAFCVYVRRQRQRTATTVNTRFII